MPASAKLFQQASDRFDQGRLVDEVPVANNFNLERADDISNETDQFHRQTGRNQRRSHGQKRIARADSIDNAMRNRRIVCALPLRPSSAMHPCLPLVTINFEQPGIRSESLYMMSPTGEMRSLSASLASGASMHMKSAFG